MSEKDWVLDCTFDNDIPAFCPYENGDIIIGMTVISDKCPGNLIGVFHSDGQELVEKWIAKHPNWYKEYKVEDIQNERTG